MAVGAAQLVNVPRMFCLTKPPVCYFRCFANRTGRGTGAVRSIVAFDEDDERIVADAHAMQFIDNSAKLRILKSQLRREHFHLPLLKGLRLRR